MGYYENQLIKYKSHEKNIQRWYIGQERFLKEWFNFPRNLRILDISCGDGVGLRYLKEMGFQNVVGVELEKEKAGLAQQYGYPVFNIDMHDLSALEENYFDIVYSSHTIEHSYDPKKVIDEIKRILKSDGIFVVVLPYVDSGPFDAHCGKEILGTDKKDNAVSVRKFFEDNGFKISKWQLDSFREPEIWLQLYQEK